jgi:hypothetical protein
MAKTKNTDSLTLELIQEVKRQKAEIAQAEKPNWITNCSFSYTENSANTIVIHVEANIKNLVGIVAFLIGKLRDYNEAAAMLGIEVPAFTWGGFSVEDWSKDIKMRIDKIQIADKKKKLETTEARLNAIISPQLRAEMELEAIAEELKK